MLSLCMIVKDEGENLCKCLDAVSPFVDEIVIVDTGSNDKTWEIALRYTDKVYSFDWCDDFGKARNFSISKASNDWVLILDADEIVTCFDKNLVEKFISSNKNQKKVASIEIVNITDEDLGEKKYIVNIMRLFNRKYFEFKGSIHEQVISNYNNCFEVIGVNISCYHSGYTKSSIQKHNKIARNLRILESAISEDLEDTYLNYQKGKTYFMARDYIKAANSFEIALKYVVSFEDEYVKDLIQSYGYALINSAQFEKAMILEEFVGIYSGDADFIFVLGLVYMNNGEFSKAAECFVECTEFDMGKVDGTTTYRAYYNLGVIFEVLGHLNEAYEFYQKCGDFEPAVLGMERIKIK